MLSEIQVDDASLGGTLALNFVGGSASASAFHLAHVTKLPRACLSTSHLQKRPGLDVDRMLLHRCSNEIMPFCRSICCFGRDGSPMHYLSCGIPVALLSSWTDIETTTTSKSCSHVEVLMHRWIRICRRVLAGPTAEHGKREVSQDASHSGGAGIA